LCGLGSGVHLQESVCVFLKDAQTAESENVFFPQVVYT
jgi:hypothetical protein